MTFKGLCHCPFSLRDYITKLQEFTLTAMALFLGVFKHGKSESISSPIERKQSPCPEIFKHHSGVSGLQGMRKLISSHFT